MSALQELNPTQANEALVAACQKRIPVTVMLRRGEAWLNMRSRFLATDGGQLILELPWVDQTGAVDDFAADEELGVSFKHKHHKHLFNTTVLATREFRGPEGNTQVMSVGCPTAMQRIQRRAYQRVSVPPNRIVRASFWLGGREREPAGTTENRPVWSGRVMNISAGGFQLGAPENVGMALELGEMVGLHMTFGASGETLFADAQFRHCEQAEQGTLMGFQFIGLGQTAEGKDALRIIADKVREYQRFELHHAARK